METVKIRIKVLMDSKGNYAGYGYKGASNQDLDDTIYECIPVDGPVQEYWINADLPVAAAIEIIQPEIEKV